MLVDNMKNLYLLVVQYFLAYLGSVVKIESKFEPPPPHQSIS